MQRAQRTSLPRDEQATARVAVEAVHELERLLRPQRAQRLDHSETQTATAVHGNAGGFVDYEQSFVFDNDRAAQLLKECVRNCRGRPFRLKAHWRHAHFVVQRQTQRRVGAATVDAHLALAHQTVHAAARDSAEEPHQELVQTPPGLVFANLDVAYALPLRLTQGSRHRNLTVTYCFYSALGIILSQLSAIGQPTVWRRCRLMLVGPRNRGHRVWADKIAAPAIESRVRRLSVARRRLSTPKDSEAPPHQGGHSSE